MRIAASMKKWVFVDIDQKCSLACALALDTEEKLEFVCFCSKMYNGPFPPQSTIFRAKGTHKDAADCYFLMTLGAWIADGTIDEKDTVYVMSEDLTWVAAVEHLKMNCHLNAYSVRSEADPPHNL